jgi:hypothetical protein
MTDDDATFILSNGTNQKVVLRGSRKLFGKVQGWFGDSEIECQSAVANSSEQEPFGFGDGNPAFYSISAGESVKVVVRTILPQRFRGGICTVRFKLASGQIAGPIEIRP